MTSRDRILLALVVVVGIGAGVAGVAGYRSLALCLAIPLAALRPWRMFRDARKSRGSAVRPPAPSRGQDTGRRPVDRVASGDQDSTGPQWEGVLRFRREYLTVYVHEMSDRGAHPRSAAPPLYRILWNCGSEVAPPHHLPFGSMVLLAGGYFGGCMALLLGGVCLLVGFPLLPGLLVAMALGLLFGCDVARHYRADAARLRLPALEEFLEHGHFPPDPAPGAARARGSSGLWLQ